MSAGSTQAIMNECTGIGKKVTIALAVYKPNISWLIEQLKSLNAQSYHNLELLIWDDCPDVPVDESLFKTYITSFSYILFRGDRNLGSNGAFEELTRKADGDFIAYCDQDDIWERDKISLMIEKQQETNAVLVCSDVSVIDSYGRKKASSITQVRKHHKFLEGNNLVAPLLMHNFILGCASLVKTEIAKEAIPFEPYYVHDQWIGIVAAERGRIAFLNIPLVRYRIHQTNQTGVLTGVNDKISYYEQKIKYFIDRFYHLKERTNNSSALIQNVNERLEWVIARANYFNNPSLKNLKAMWGQRNISKAAFYLEMVLPLLPNCCFKAIVLLVKKGII